MNISKVFNIASAVVGFAGTALMYKGTFGLVVPGFYFMDAAGNAAIKKANDRRLMLQRVGLALLTISFLLEGLAQFTPA